MYDAVRNPPLFNMGELGMFEHIATVQVKRHGTVNDDEVEHVVTGNA